MSYKITWFDYKNEDDFPHSIIYTNEKVCRSKLIFRTFKDAKNYMLEAMKNEIKDLVNEYQYAKQMTAVTPRHEHKEILQLERWFKL